MIESVEIDPKIRIRNPEKLLVLPKVIRVRGFSELAAKKFSTEMSLAHQSGQPVIPVVIDSYGGDTYALLSMIDVIKSAHVPVATIVLGKAFSCGVLLFSCGTEGYRFVAPNSTLMIHDVSSWEPESKTEEIVSSAKETQRLNKQVYRIMDLNTGHKPGYFWDLVQERSRADWYVTAKEAINHNIANHIKIPTLKTKVSVDIDLTF